MTAAAAVRGVGLALGLAGCASHDVRIPLAHPPEVPAGRYRRLVVGALELPRLGDLDVALEARRFLATEARGRTGYETGLAGDPGEPGPEGAVVLTGSGRLEETVLGARGDVIEELPTDLATLPAPGRPRWERAYRLRLELELRDAATGERLWSERFERERPPAAGAERLFALYELLEPVGDALVAALAGSRDEQTRRLPLP